MDRKAAIETFGASYYTEIVPLKDRMTAHEGRLYSGIGHVRVVECLGTEEGRYATAEEAKQAALETIAGNVETRLAEIAVWEASVKTRIRIAAAKMGLHRDAEDYLGRMQTVRDAAARLQDIKEQGVLVETKNLPDALNLPVKLEKGDKIYRVEAYYLSRAMDVAKTPVTAHEITAVELKNNRFGRNGYDYIFTYHLDNGERFEYPFDEKSEAPIDTSIVNYRYFLTEAGAKGYMRDIAQRITNAMKPYL